ncbi:MAG: hypothetical protein AB3N12_00830 [Ruegeria sp.]
MIRFATRSAQISAFLICGASGALADTPMKVTTFAAPEDFTHFLHKHDGGQRKFDFTDKWVDPERSDVIVVFIENREDIDFVPAKLYTSFQTVLSMFDAHFYEISSRVYGDTLNSDVYIVSVSRLQNKLVEDGFSIEQAQKGAFVSCFAAGLVEDFYRQGNLDANHRKIGDTCAELLEK